MLAAIIISVTLFMLAGFLGLGMLFSALHHLPPKNK